MMINRESKILKETFRDQLTATRKQAGTDPDTQETVFQDVMVFENIPCALSNSSGDAPERTEKVSVQSRDMVIFTLPGVFLQANDKVTVTTEAGQIYKGRTGRTFGYISHGETPFLVEDLS